MITREKAYIFVDRIRGILPSGGNIMLLLILAIIAIIPTVVLHHAPVLFAYGCIPYIAIVGILIVKWEGRRK